MSNYDLGMVAPLAGVDHELAHWCRNHLTNAFGDVLCLLSKPGSGGWIAIVLLASVIFLVWRRRWHGLISMILIVPGGLLLNCALKVLVHRQRPFVHGAFAFWDGYSFPSGHTIGATLLYGMLIAALFRAVKDWHIRLPAVAGGAILVLLVGFSRIALGAHYLTDVLGAIALGIVWLLLCLSITLNIRRSLVRMD